MSAPRVLPACEGCGRDDVELGRDQAGDTLCFDCVMERWPTTGRPHAENGHGQAPPPAAPAPPGQVEAIRRALLEEAQDTRDATGPARDPVPGTGGMLHRGVSCCLFGERGGGKSMAALVLTLSAAVAGERVLYLDRENEAALTNDRAECALAAHDDWPEVLASERWVGRHFPEFRKDWKPEAFGEAIAGLGFTVVVLDSLREYLSQLDLNPDKEQDVSAFLSRAVTPLRRKGVAVVVLDNIGHENTDRPKGSGSKLDAVPQVYKVVTSEEFTPR